MTVSIYHVTFKHNGTANTLLQCVLVPNWFEAKVLRKQRARVNYIGHKQTWHVHPNGPPLQAKGSKRLAAIEKELQAIAKKKNTRILKFR